MKKLGLMLLILSLIALPAFSAPAKPVKAETASSVEISTLVQEASMADYPGVLVKGSITGTDIFVQDLTLLGNSAIFEYLSEYTYNPELDYWQDYIGGQASFATDLGTFGLSVKPAKYYYMQNSNFYEISGLMYYDYTLYQVFGLSYANKIGDVPFGVSAQYGTQKNNYKNLNYEDSDADFGAPAMFVDYSDADIQNYSVQYMALKAGVSLTLGLPLDLSFGFTQYNHLDSCEDWFDAYNYNGWGERDSSKTNFNLSIRTDLGEEFFVVTMLDWTKSNFKARVKDPNNTRDSQFVSDNSKLDLKALAGKTIAVGKSLKVSVASGLLVSGDSDPLMYFEFFNDNSPWGQGKFYMPNDYTNSSSVAIPFNFAVEGTLNETWTVNSGVNCTFVVLNGYKYDYQSSDFGSEPKITRLSEEYENAVSPELSYTIGLTGVIGDLKLDMFLNPYILMTGPNFLSGQSVGNLNSGVAVSYLWK